jgi:hypothetical protein
LHLFSSRSNSRCYQLWAHLVYFMPISQSAIQETAVPFIINKTRGLVCSLLLDSYYCWTFQLTEKETHVLTMCTCVPTCLCTHLQTFLCMTTFTHTGVDELPLMSASQPPLHRTFQAPPCSLAHSAPAGGYSAWPPVIRVRHCSLHACRWGWAALVLLWGNFST